MQQCRGQLSPLIIRELHCRFLDFQQSCHPLRIFEDLTLCNLPPCEIFFQRTFKLCQRLLTTNSDFPVNVSATIPYGGRRLIASILLDTFLIPPSK